MTWFDPEPPDDLTGIRTYSEVFFTWSSYAEVKASVLNYNLLLYRGGIYPGLLDHLFSFSASSDDALVLTPAVPDLESVP